MGQRRNYYPSDYRTETMTPRRRIFPEPPTPEPGLTCYGDEHRAGLTVGCDEGARAPINEAQNIERWATRDHKKRDRRAILPADEPALLAMEDKADRADRRREAKNAKARAITAARAALAEKHAAIVRVAKAVRPVSLGTLRRSYGTIGPVAARPMPRHQGPSRRRHSGARIGTR
jgi:hypothetical protein